MRTTQSNPTSTPAKTELFHLAELLVTDAKHIGGSAEFQEAVRHGTLTPEALLEYRLPASLPVERYIPDIIKAFQRCSTLVLGAPTGTGKTTLIPKLLREAKEFEGYKIIVLEPRRLATEGPASYIGDQDGEIMGETVGFRHGLEQQAQPESRLVFETSGYRLIKMMSELKEKTKKGQKLDPVLIVLDEFHERDMNQDTALALIKELQGKGHPVKLMIMSATLNEAELKNYLKDFVTIKVTETRQPVHHLYPTKDSPIEHRVSHYIRCGLDVLVVDPQKDRVEQIADTLTEELAEHDVTVIPLHSNRGRKEQQEALDQSEGQRRAIVSTDIGKTGLTFGVQVVILCDEMRTTKYVNGIKHLVFVPTDLASTIQWAGRAGRSVVPAIVEHHSDSSNAVKAAHQEPEILRADLSGIMLRLLAAGYRIEELDYLTKPDAKQVAAGYKTLQALRLVDALNNITPYGLDVARLPLSPVAALIALKALDYESDPSLKGLEGITRLAVVLACLLETEPMLSTKVQNWRSFCKGENNSELFAALDVYRHIVASLALDNFTDADFQKYGIKQGVFESIRLREQSVIRALGIKANLDTQKQISGHAQNSELRRKLNECVWEPLVRLGYIYVKFSKDNATGSGSARFNFYLGLEGHGHNPRIAADSPCSDSQVVVGLPICIETRSANLTESLQGPTGISTVWLREFVQKINNPAIPYSLLASKLAQAAEIDAPKKKPNPGRRGEVPGKLPPSHRQR